MAECEHPTYMKHIYVKCQDCGYAVDFRRDESAEDYNTGDMCCEDAFECNKHDDNMRVEKTTWQCSECGTNLG